MSEAAASGGARLPVMERFLTVQGEGAFTGTSAWFIRLAGCDVGCAWCDVKESWDATSHPLRSVDELVAGAAAFPARIAVITGGEPLLHDLAELTGALRSAGFRTHLETSGTHPLSGDWHHICFSPKKFKAPLPAIFAAAHELKVIVINKHDLDWGQQHALQVNTACALYLQPEWSKRETITPLIVDHVKSHPRWQISLQTHKYLNIP